jgi:activator of HSP90 ATPase
MNIFLYSTKYYFYDKEMDMAEKIKVSDVIQADAKTLYKAWLDSKEHGAFTGGKADIDPKKGGKFTAWDGYISGKTLELEPFKRIVQSWRTTEFPDESEDSKLEILFEEANNATKMTFIHTDIPDGQGEEYKQGWIDYYFEPMKEYFSDN